MVHIEELDADDAIVDPPPPPGPEAVPKSNGLLSLRSTIGESGCFNGPWGVALLPEGMLCVSERHGARLQLVQPASIDRCAAIASAVQFDDIQDVVADAGPSVWVADMGTHAVHRIDVKSGEALESLHDGLSYPRCLALQQNNARGALPDDGTSVAGPRLPQKILWVGDSGHSRVVAYDAETLSVILEFGESTGENDGVFAPGRLQLTLGLCVDEEHGEVFVVDGHFERISVFASSNGKFVRCIGQPGTGPGEFKSPFDALIVRGRLVVTEATRVQVLTLEGVPLSVVELPDASNLAGLCLDGDLIHVCDYTRGCIYSLEVGW